MAGDILNQCTLDAETIPQDLEALIPLKIKQLTEGALPNMKPIKQAKTALYFLAISDQFNSVHSQNMSCLRTRQATHPSYTLD